MRRFGSIPTAFSKHDFVCASLPRRLPDLVQICMCPSTSICIDVLCVTPVAYQIPHCYTIKVTPAAWQIPHCYTINVTPQWCLKCRILQFYEVRYSTTTDSNAHFNWFIRTGVPKSGVCVVLARYQHNFPNTILFVHLCLECSQILKKLYVPEHFNLHRCLMCNFRCLSDLPLLHDQSNSRSLTDSPLLCYQRASLIVFEVQHLAILWG